MLPADLVDEQQRRADRPVGLPIGDDEADAGIVWPGNFAAVGSTGIVIASKRMPGSRIVVHRPDDRGAFSHGAPICSNGRSVPRPSVRFVPSK